MNDREKIFFDNLIIDVDDIPRAKRNLKSKGIEKHILIKERLMVYSESGKVKYSQIASIYRYDKRLRLTLYKFVSYLEEWYRSIILDNYYNDFNSLKPTKELREKIKETNSLNNALELIDFWTLMVQIMKIPYQKRNGCRLPKNLQTNSIALRELRNAVMHNKFLLLYRGFEECYPNNESNQKSTTLTSNIKNLINFLPKEVGEKCREEINKCSEDRNTSGDTKWDLPDFIIINI